MGSLTRLRIAGLAEGTTLVLLLLVAVPLKRLAGWPLGVTLVGPLHGVTFLFYLVTLIEAAAAGALRGGPLARAAIASLIPFGTFVNDHALRARLRAPSEAGARR